MNPYSKLTFFLILLLVLHVVASDEFFHEERDSLIQLRDSLSSIANLHSNWTGPPCHKDQSRWFGITCSNSHVTEIDLQGIELTGTLQSTALQSITFLTNLSLSNNALHGDLPTLKGLLNLSVVSFSKNRFSGSIPTEYVALSNISRLELQDNLLNGLIPRFEQASLIVFNVSFNFLQGKIPETSALQRFPNSSYRNNLELCGKPLEKACNVTPVPQTQDHDHPVSSTNQAPSSSPISSSTKSLEVWSLALIAMAAVMLPIILILCFLCYKRRQKKAIKLGYNHVGHTGKPKDDKKKTRNVELEFFSSEREVFDLDELLRSSAEMVGKGKLGITYKAMMESGSIVVVKRLKGMSGVTRNDFVHQMQMLGRLRHENLVEIITCYYSTEEKLVIYEHVPSGSLFQLLHGHEGEGKVHLNWEARRYIVKGIARGMAYLHHSLPIHQVPHGNLKSSNVLIDHNNSYPYYSPKITDFGLQQLAGQASTRKLAAGKSPEMSRGDGELTAKADVFCFGIVLLEMMTGKVPSENEEEVLEWVTMISDNKWSTGILDSELVVEKEKHMEMFKLVQIGLECVALQPETRPTMSEVVRRMEEMDEERTWL
ncbi:hypothetical protein J5N97_023795 [Dioscorea zingiberensis]|uniref:Protein kinase domain-containing protein n=1 Tax=Dioscorea zingiberensis TaxID=325984 RepID=A0A9D5C5T3_9LILI|nr:hypothetical protein J5N97_023795 [Dioscorea zingiberensis]